MFRRPDTFLLNTTLAASEEAADSQASYLPGNKYHSANEESKRCVAHHITSRFPAIQCIYILGLALYLCIFFATQRLFCHYLCVMQPYRE